MKRAREDRKQRANRRTTAGKSVRARHVFGEALREEQLEAGIGEHAQRRRIRVQAAAGEALATQQECIKCKATS